MPRTSDFNPSARSSPARRVTRRAVAWSAWVALVVLPMVGACSDDAEQNLSRAAEPAASLPSGIIEARNRERLTTHLDAAALIEAFAEEKDLVLDGVGSWTIKEEAKKRGLEPDECYVLGERQKPPTIPDIAIEVVWTSGGL